MVRLQRDRWYTASGMARSRQRAQQQSRPGRQLGSLLLALILVTMLMQQASNPLVWSRAFRALGTPLDSAAVTASQGPIAPGSGGSSSSSSSSSPPGDGLPDPETLFRMAVHRDQVAMWRVLLQQLPAKDRQWLARALYETTWRQAVAGSPSVSDLKRANQPIGSLDGSQRDTSTSEPSTKGDSPPVGYGGKGARDQDGWKRWGEISQAEWMGWELVMEGLPSSLEPGTAAISKDPAAVARQELVAHWKLLVDSMTSPRIDQELLASESMGVLSEGSSGRALIEALDGDLIETLRDGAPWQAAERLAFLRQFQIALHNPANGIAHWISTTQLDSSGSEYRGQAIGLVGQVAQVDPSQRVSDAMLGDMGYRPWWMRPADGASQPWLIYLPEPVWVAARQSNPSFPETQEGMQGVGCRIEAIYLKRLAYRSKRGVDVVPVLIARRIDPESASIAAGSPPAVLPSASKRSLPWPPWRPPGRELAALRTLGGVLGPLMDQLRDEVTATSEWYSKPEMEEPPADGNGTAFAKSAPAPLLAIIHQMDRPSDLVREWAEQPRLAERWNVPLRSMVGTARWWQQLAVTGEEAEWFGGDRCYRFWWEPARDSAPAAVPPSSVDLSTGVVDKKLSAGGFAGKVATGCWIYCRQIPRLWLPSARIDQPVTVAALWLAIDAPNSPAIPSQGLAIASHIDWSWDGWSTPLPDGVEALPATFRQLGSQGWNLAQIDTMERLQGKPIQRDDGEALMPLLRLVTESATGTGGGAEASVLVPANEAEKSTGVSKAPRTLAQVLRDPFGAILQPVAISVRLLRAVRIEVVDPAERQWLGADHYYEVDGMGDLQGTRIDYRPSSKAGEPIRFEGEFPVTLLASKLPAELLAEGEVMEETQTAQIALRGQVEVEGLHYRMWAYRSQRIANRSIDRPDDATGAQLAPLIAVAKWTVVPPLSVSQVRRAIDQGSSIWFWGMAGIAGLAWWWIRRDAVARRRLRAKGRGVMDRDSGQRN
jgi:hypothetical protein